MGHGARVSAVLVTVCLLATAACSPGLQGDDATPDPDPTPTEPPVHTAELQLPDAEATVLDPADPADPAELAAAASRTFFASAPVAILAPPDDVATQVRAAAVAVALGSPLLIAEPTTAADEGEAGDGAPGGESGTDVGTDTAEEETEGDVRAPDGGAGTDTSSPQPPADGATSSSDGATSPGPTQAPPDPAAVELERLGVLAVVTLGDASTETDPGVDVVPAPSDDAGLAALLRRDLGPAEPPAEGAELDAVAALDRDAPTLPGASTPVTAPTQTDEPAAPGTRTASGSGSGSGSEEGSDPDVDGDGTSEPDPSASDTGEPTPALPLLELPDALTGGLLMTTGEPTDLAAVATARAAGVQVLTVASGDPRASSATVQAVAEAAPEHVVGLGPGFGGTERLAWTTATAATGVELPGGGQTIFPGRRFVAMYGTPSFAGLGILGEQGLPESIARAEALAAEFQPLTDDVVVPAFEIIVTVASAGAGDDGNYSNELPVDSFVPWVEAARDAGVYVVLDLQPGRTDFLTQAKLYESLLKYPNVGLALDPEWRLEPDQVHLRQIGSVGIEEVNAVQDYLAELTRTNRLPQKLFVLHQFSLRMIQDRELLDTSHPELAVLIHADGQGSQPAKAGTWAALHRGAPEGIAWGWKNFIDEDSPMLTPEQTYQVSPAPQFVSYQ